MNVEIRVLAAGDEALLLAASDVFDQDARPDLVAEFLADPRHHIAVATAGDRVVGFVSAVHYVHPDKEPQLWVNEIGVVPDYRAKGVGSELVRTMLAVGRTHGCSEAWVLTESDNEAAKHLYASTGGVQSTGDAVMFEFPIEPA